MEINEQLKPIVNDLIEKLRIETEDEIRSEVKKQISKIDIKSLVEQLVKQVAQEYITKIEFPVNSIHHSSINFGGIKLTGNHIRGGVIEDFGSIGIEDRSTHTQLTLMDHATVVESPVYTTGLNVKGDSRLEGNLNITGTVSLTGTIDTNGRFFKDIVDHSTAQLQTNLDAELFKRYTNVLYSEINERGLDLTKIRHKNREVITEDGIAYHIKDSNLQRVGLLKDLQTQGDTLLSETFFVANKRVGVNTLEPGATFVVWDHECEMIICKRSENQGYIGTQRHQSLSLGSNNHDNIVLTPDGEAKISNLQINNVPMTSGPGAPSYQGRRGEIVWNENPNTGSPVGWICIGKNQWGQFGTIK